MKRGNAFVLNTFAQNVRAGNLSFVVKHNDSEYYSHFIGSQIGNAVFYYVSDGRGSDFFFEKDVQYKPCAIYADSKIYVMNYYEFNLFNKLPDGVEGDDIIIFSDYCAKLNAKLRLAIAAYYNALKKFGANPVDTVKAREDARKHIILSYDYMAECRKFEIVFSIKEIKNILAYGLDIDGEINRIIDAHKDKIAANKAYEKKVAELVALGNVAEKWEVRLAKIREAKAEYVTVEFEIDGKTATGKMQSNTLLRGLNKSDYFSTYDFKTDKEGREIFKVLGVTNKTRLYCTNIAKVVFRGKAIYERSESNAS